MATPANTTTTSIDRKLPNRFLINVKYADVVRLEIEKHNFVFTLKSGHKQVVHEGALLAELDESISFLFVDDHEVNGRALLESSQVAETFDTALHKSASDSFKTNAVPATSTNTSLLSKGEASEFSPGNKAMGAALALALAGGGGGGGGGANQSVGAFTQGKELVIKAAAGPMVNQQLIKVYDSDGALITSQVMTDGTCTLTLPKNYSGPILIEMSDSNAAGVDYIDENTGQGLSLTNSLRAFTVITAGDTSTSVSITPVTEIAVKLAIQNGLTLPLSSAQPLSSTTVNDNNQVVGQRLLNGKNILDVFVTIINSSGVQNAQYNELDGLSDAELYGQLLAKLSSNDAITGSTAATVNEYVKILAANGANAQTLIKEMLLQGAQTFEQGTQAPLAELALPIANLRTLRVPVSINQLKADEETGASLRCDQSANPFADAQKELADGQVLLKANSTALQLPVALSAEALVGDQLTVNLSASSGGVAQIVTYTLTGNDIRRGFANVAFTVLQLAESGIGTKTLDARLIGVDGADSGSYNPYLVNQTQLELRTSISAFAQSNVNDTNTPAPTVADYEVLGIHGVDLNNLSTINSALATLNVNAQSVSTPALIQSLVDSYNTGLSLNLIQAYANDASNTTPTHQHYVDVGVTGVDANNVASINTVLATAAVTAQEVSTVLDIQAIVDAYQTLFDLANGTDDALNGSNPADSVYALLGVTGVDSATKTSLLGDVIDIKSNADIQTAPQIQALADAVNAVMQGAAGHTGPSLDELTRLGITGVDASNMPAVLLAIANTNANGSDVDTLAELQSVVNTGQATVQAVVNVIQAFALANTSPRPTAPTGTAPTVNDYANAGITGVDAQNLASINDALATSTVTNIQVNSVSKVQALVNAYLAVFNAADGQANNATNSATLPVQGQYGLIGITGVDSVAKAKLLGNKLDALGRADVDLTGEIQTLADAASAVVNAAAGVSGLTRSQLSTQFGITGLTADNWPAVVLAIANTADDGTGVDTLAKLQALVTSTSSNLTAARSVITTYADANSGTAPTVADYAAAGVTGVNDNNLAALNNALASVPVVGTSVDTTAELQAVVDAYNAMLSAADGFDNINNNQNPTQAQYGLIGVTGVNSGVRTSLLGDVIDRKYKADIDTVAELQNLADAVAAVMTGAAGGTAPTLVQWTTLGITGVNAGNLNKVNQALAGTAANGTDVDTIAELQTVVTNALNASTQAISVIQTYALQNSSPAPAVPTGTAPTVNNYTQAGVTGVTLGNVSAINDALATAAITDTSVATTAAIQLLVDAYLAIFNAADGVDDLASVNPLQAQYGSIGIIGVDSAAKTSLLGDVIDIKASTDVDTIIEIQTLAQSVLAVMNQANGVVGLTQAQLTGLGVTGLTTDNFAAVLRAITNTADDGAGVDTLSELQSLVGTASTNAATARSVIATYADANSGTAPTLNDYAAAGVQGVDSTHLAAFNNALASVAVIGSQVDTTAKAQNFVNAYNALFALADGIGNTSSNAYPNSTAYSTIGVTGVDSNVKGNLLSSAIDKKLLANIDTVTEIQTLADASAAVIAAAAGDTNLTVTDLQNLGVTGVDASNLAYVVDLINNTSDSGSDVDSVDKIQALINPSLGSSAPALFNLGVYADRNALPLPTLPTGTAPVLSDYTDAGATGVDANNLASLNDALATAAVRSTSIDTSVKLQQLVDAYLAILNAANGVDNAASVNPTQAQYGYIGITDIDSAAKASLLGDAIDIKTNADVNTIEPIQNLANIASLVMQHASDVATALSQAQLTALGITELTTDNIPAVLQAIANTANDGSGVDTLAELQALVTTTSTGAVSARSVIEAYADANSGTAPTLNDYLAAGVTGVDSTRVASINSALASASVVGTSVNSTAKLQALVNAYNALFGVADGVDNTANNSNPSALTYSLVGVTNANTDANTSLLGDAIDLKNDSDIDTVVELQNLANAVSAVMACAAGNAGPSVAQLTLLGISGVNAGNLPVALQAIANTADNGAAVSTLADLQAVIDAALNTSSTALNVISTYAQQNSGTLPTVSDYANAGTTVAANQLSAINSALATPNVQGTNVDTSVEVKALVEAYQAVFALADGTANQGTTVSAAQLNLLGATTGSAATTSSYLALVNSVLDRQAASAVNTVSKINALITITNAIQDTATGVTPSHSLQASDFTQIGVNGVTANNLASVLTAIANSGATGSDSVAELQALVYGASQLSLNSISTDTGFSNTDFITSDATLTFYGTSNTEDGSRIKLVITPTSGAPIELLATVNAGAWEAPRYTALLNGTYTVNTYLVDTNDDTTVLKTATSRTLVVDNSEVNLPNGTVDTALQNKLITIGAISPDTGNSSTDFVTNNGQVIFSGTSTAPDGTHVMINIDGNVAYTVVNAGTWQYDNTANTLSAGTHTVSVALNDAAGNQVSYVTQNVNIDTAGLIITSKTAGSIATGSNLQLQFSENVYAQANKSIVIWDETANAVFETIAVNDLTKVTIFNKTVNINPSADFVVGNNYHALIDNDAFRSIATSFTGISNITSWTFRPVDPATDLNLAPPSVDSSNGINGSELASMNLTGTVSSPDITAVSNLTIGRITFTPTGNNATVVLTNNLPIVDPSTYVWTLVNNASWTSQLVSGERYTVSVQLNGSIHGTPTQSTISTSIGLVDTIAPTLLITSNAPSTLKSGDTALVTFTFSEAPTGFTPSDVTLSNGSLNNFTVTNDPKVYTATFVPNANVSGSYTPIAVASGTYTDANGNAGGAALGPTWTIDTTLPTISAVAISGVDSSLAAKNTDLGVGDKVKVTLTFSEVVLVTGSPTFSLNIGGVTKNATYMNGSGTNTLVFYYTVVLGDNDLSQGLTATADAVALNGGTIQDAVSNNANLATLAIADGTNTVVVDTNATALITISGAAQANSADANTTSVAVFEKAGVVGVTTNNLSAINSALNTTDVTATQTDTTPEVQDLVNAYITVLALADGGSNVGTAASALQYSLMGVQGISTVTAGASSVPAGSKASLLSDIIDKKAFTAVDTVAEVQALADMVSHVMLAANGTTAGLTLSQLTSMGITGVTSNNLSFVLQAIASEDDSGSSVDTLSGLQLIVNNGIAAAKTAAMQIISQYAASNSGTAPTLVEYANAEVTGVDANNLASINDTLTTIAVDSAAVSTTADIQSIVDAYNLVLALADGGVSAGTTVTAAQLTKLGVNTGNISTLSANLNLINNILDKQARTGVDTVSEINALTNITNSIQTAITSDVAASLLYTDFSLIGLTGVTSANVGGINSSIASREFGTDLDTLSELQKLIDTYSSELTIGLTNDSGYSPTDKITNSDSLTVGGNLLADGTIYYSVDSANDYNTVYTPVRTPGWHSVNVKQVDSAGNSSKVSLLTYLYDNTAPTIDLNLFVPGKNGYVSTPPKSVSLNSTQNQYVSIGNNITVNEASFVLRARFKLSSTQASGASIIDLSTTSNSDRMMLGFAANNILVFKINSNNDTTTVVEAVGSALNTNQWYSVVVTGYNNGSVQMIVNGNVVRTVSPVSLTTTFTSTNNFVGKSYNNNYFNGEIFDVSVGQLASGANGKYNASNVVGFPENTPYAYYASLGDNKYYSVTPGATTPSSGTITTYGNPGVVAVTDASMFLSLDAPAYISSTNISQDANAIVNIKIKVGGLHDGSNEKLVFRTTNISGSSSFSELALTGSTPSGSISIYNLGTWNWVYAGGTYTFTSGTTIPNASVSTFINLLAYYNSAVAATDGARTFTITTTDAAGNQSLPTVASVVVDTHTPTINATPVALDANSDFIKGDEFIIQFAERVQTSGITNTSNWTFSGTAVIGNATITPIDAIMVDTVEYATSFWVKRGNTSTYTFSPFSKALALDGSSQYAVLGQVHISLDITLEAWIYISEMPVGAVYPRIIDLSNGFAVKALRLLYTPSGALVLGYSDEGGGTAYYGDYVSVVGSITAGNWMHVAATVSDSGAVTLYKNGVVLDKLLSNDNIWNNWGTVMNDMTWTNVWVGKSSYNDGYVKGLINDVRIYDKLRTAEEIRADMQGAINPNDTNLKAYYTFDGTLASGTTWGTTASMNAGAATYTNGTTMSINGSAVIDTNSRTAGSTQTITLSALSSAMSGTEGNNTLTGDSSNNFLAGLGGNDTLTGGAGGDTFAWLKGDTGNDSVTDFKTAEGDMINLSGLLTGTTLGPNTLPDDLATYLQLSQSGANAILKVDLLGASNFATPTKTITLTNGWDNGLSAGLSALVTQKTIILDSQRATPLILDLKGDGVHTTTLGNGVVFDMLGNGQSLQTAWVDTTDGLLALDLNNDGLINNGTELFGDSTRLGSGNKAQDGFQALAQYDGNHDGVIDGLDTVFANLKVWVDANHNGVSEAAELHTLAQLGVQSMQLGATPSTQMDNGNLLGLLSSWTDTSGHTHVVADVLLTNTSLKHDAVI